MLRVVLKRARAVGGARAEGDKGRVRGRRCWWTQPNDMRVAQKKSLVGGCCYQIPQRRQVVALANDA